MALKPVRPRLRNISNGLAKIQISVPAGDELEVSAEVAAQLAHQGAPFRDATAPEPAAGAPVEDPAPVKARATKRPAKKA